MKGKFISTGLVKVKRYDAFFCLLEMSSDANSQNLLDTKSKKTDWNQCAICQENKNESLQCPADSKCQSDVGAGYKTLATNLVKFSDLGCLPVQIDLSRLDEGGKGIEETFRKNNARWHRSCYSCFNSTKVKRAEKRSMNVDNDNGVGGKYTRSCSTSTTYPATCFIFVEIRIEKPPFRFT